MNRCTYQGSILICLAASAFSLAASAQSQGTISTLNALYESTGGDQWHENSGWLDPTVDVCDWYGVSCRGSQGGQGVIDQIDLSDNNLVGAIDLASLDDLSLTKLDLSGNSLTGAINRAPVGIHLLDLSNNRFEGLLPALREQDIPLIADGSPHSWRFVNNQFNGAIPTNWSELRLRVLDLTGNELETNVVAAFETIGRYFPGFLGIADNQFSGVLPSEASETLLALHDAGTFGGLNLCWNDWQIQDPDLSEWIAAHHVGGEFASCINRERIQVTAEISGSWFSPERSGEGMTLMMLDRGEPLVYWFSFNTEGQQQWAFEVGLNHEESLQWQRLIETRGDFSAGIRFIDGQRVARPLMGARLDRLTQDSMHFERRYWDYAFCPPLQNPGGSSLPCVVMPISDRLDYTRLSELAGTTCSNQSPYQQYSGAWFDPFRAGEGFVVEALPDERAVVYWFTYKPDGSGEQAWMIGQGRFASSSDVQAVVNFETIYQPIGGTYGEAFDPDAVENVNWGSLMLEFDTEDTGRVHWDSNLEGYGSGEYPIVRLARPMQADCP